MKLSKGQMLYLIAVVWFAAFITWPSSTGRIVLLIGLGIGLASWGIQRFTSMR